MFIDAMELEGNMLALGKVLKIQENDNIVSEWKE
jgi:hypothetical protein